MKKTLKSIMIIFGIFATIVAVLLGSILYITCLKVAVVDTVQSADGAYEVILQAVGEPGWPFGPAPG